jgi:flagellar basal-body rod protein FlgC
MDNGGGRGVKASSVEKDTDTPGRLVYDPTHPDAIKSGKRAGYVEYSNVNVVSEMTDLISAERAYQANIQVLNTAKTMFEMALQIGS